MCFIPGAALLTTAAAYQLIGRGEREHLRSLPTPPPRGLAAKCFGLGGIVRLPSGPVVAVVLLRSASRFSCRCSEVSAMAVLSSCRALSSNLRLLSPRRLSGLTSTECQTQSLSSSVNAPASVPDATAVSPPREFVSEKFRALMAWYEEVTGLREVRLSQDKVLTAEDRFIASQNARRDVSKELAVVRDKLKDIYSELEGTSRGEDRYVQLITQEHRVIKDERRLAELFNRCEQEERENFSLLSSAVKESHEKERIQAERTKYWSIIGSIIGTMIGIGGSSINNEFKMRELRKLVKESAQATLLSRQEADVPKDLLLMSNNIKEISQRLAQEQVSVMKVVQAHSVTLEDQLSRIREFSENKVRVTPDGQIFNIDQLLESQRRENRIFAAVCLSSVVCFCVLSRIFS